MQGHFEINNTAYPIGYMKHGEATGYKVTDMRNLHSLHCEPIPQADAVRIAAETNARIRAGTLRLRDDDTSVSDFVQVQLEGIQE